MEGCRRNSLVYRKIGDDLLEAGFSRSLEQCREKIKKLKAEYKKVRDKRETTDEGRYPEWEYFDALDSILGPKHSTQPPTVVESLLHIGPNDETQDMSGETIVPAVQSPAPGSSSVVNTEDGDRQPSGSGSQPQGSGTQPSGSESQPSGSGGNKSRKRKRGSEATNELLEKMVAMQKSSDQMMMSLEEKRMKMEERQIELDAQMRREERQFQLQMMQMLMQQNMVHSKPPPPPPHYPMHSAFNFGSAADHGFDPDETQDGL